MTWTETHRCISDSFSKQSRKPGDFHEWEVVTSSCFFKRIRPHSNKLVSIDIPTHHAYFERTCEFALNGQTCRSLDLRLHENVTIFRPELANHSDVAHISCLTLRSSVKSTPKIHENNFENLNPPEVLNHPKKCGFRVFGAQKCLKRWLKTFLSFREQFLANFFSEKFLTLCLSPIIV